MNKKLLIVGSLITIALLLGVWQCEKREKSNEKLTEISINGKTFDVVDDNTTTTLSENQVSVAKNSSDFKPQIIFIPGKSPKVDTAEIIKQYLASVVYRDTLFLGDSLGTVTILDTLRSNRIASRIWTAKIKEKRVINTKYLQEKPKAHIYAGGSIATNVSLEASVLYQSKSSNIYELGIGANGFGSFIKAGIYLKLR
jgi:hypothetical protein